MKGLLIGIVSLFFLGCVTAGNVVIYKELDLAINQACQNIQNDFDERANIAVLNINSLSGRLSEYIIEEAMNNFTNMHIYKVVERNKISAVLSEQNFQLSGNVSDDTIQSIGNMLGAQFVVLGALDDVGRYYRLRLFVIAVETGERKSSTAVNIIKPNKQVVHLLGDVDIIENIPLGERVIGGYMAVFAEIYKILNDKDSPIIYIYPDEASDVIFATREALRDSWMVDYYHDEEYEVKFISGEWVLINKLYNPSFTPSSTSSSRAYENETFNNLIDSVIDGDTAIAIVQQAGKCYIRIWH